MICTSCGRNFHNSTGICPICNMLRKPGLEIDRPKRDEKGREISDTGNHYLFAGFWYRLLALLVDTLIVQVFHLVLFIPAFMGMIALLIGGKYLANQTGLKDWIATLVENNQSHLIAIVGIGFLLFTQSIYALYGAIFESSRFHGTPGKILFGIIVTDEHGSPISFWRAFARNFVKILSAFILGLGYLIAAFNSQKQAMHDMLTQCLVLRDTRISNLRFFMGILIAISCLILAAFFPAFIEGLKSQ